MEPNLILTKEDFEKLTALVAYTETEAAAMLEEELSRAKVVTQEELPNDVVTMNSKVVFQDVDSGNETVITLVYPPDANADEGKISVLAPIGAALIGLRVGQEIKWPLPNGKAKKVKVLKVLSQPETRTKDLGA